MIKSKKYWGQHFLHDQSVVQELLQAILKYQPDHVIEIGPGRGALTSQLLSQLKPSAHLTVIEIDVDMINYLKRQFQPQIQTGRFNIIQSDVLKQSFESIVDPDSNIKTLVTGNLPYNISSPILFHLMPVAQLLVAQIFMLQKEVVDRIVAQAGESARSRLSIAMQWRYQCKAWCDIPPSAFDPPPKVWSRLVQLVPHLQIDHTLWPGIESVAQIAFAQRRKQIANTLGKIFKKNDLAQLGIGLSQRPQEMALEKFIELAKILPADALHLKK